MFRKFSFKRYFLSWIVFFGVIYLFFILGSKKIFASIDGEPNCHLWTVSEIDSNGNMELKDYKSDGIDLKSIVVPNAADFKQSNPTKYANLQRIYIAPDILKKAAKYADQDGGEFKISKTSGQKVFPGNPNSNDVSLKDLFRNYTLIQPIDLENLDTSNVTDMYRMFHQCTNLKKLNISNWNTSKVTNMESMFYKCSNLTELALNSWDTSNVTNMDSMFENCTNLKELNISNWNTSKVTNMSDMFSYCTNLVELDLNSWDTSNVINVGFMFAGCTNLKKLNVSNWKVTNIKSLDRMVRDTINLKFLDLNSWNLNENIEKQLWSTFWIVDSKEPLLVRTRDNVLKNYDYNHSNRTFFTTTLKVDGDFAKFKIDPDEENVSYSDDGKEKYIIIYPMYTTTDSEEEIMNKLKNRLMEERDKIEFKNGQKIDWVPEENYKYVDDALGGTYMIGAEKYSATLKVDGKIAKFKENNNSLSLKAGSYNSNRTEKYISIDVILEEDTDKKIVWTKLKKILEDEKENIEIDENYSFIKWNPDIDESQEPNQSLGTYSVKTKGYLMEDVNFSWPQLKSGINVGESILIKDLFCITDSPNIPAGCKLIYKIGDGEGTYWVEYTPNDKLVFDKSGELKIYLKIDGGENYFDKKYEKNGLNYMTFKVGEKYSATLKVDGKIAKFKENTPGQYSPDRTEKYIDIYFTPTGSNDKKIVWQELKRILEAEKENIEVDSSHGLVTWNPDINENKEPNKSLGTYFINTKGYLVEGTDFSWPELKSDIKIGELISVKDFFGIKSVPKVPQGCKLIYKISDENSSGWKEYLATDTVLFEKAIDYKIYLKIDGGENYFDREYEKNGRNYLILRIGNKDTKDDDSDEGTGIFHWDTISDGKVSLKSIGLPSRLKTEKYLEGYSDGTIKPNNNVKRGEFANMIYKLMHDEKEKVNTDVLKNLNDVKSSDWYGASVAYVLDKKIFDTGKNFRPNENVTRGEVAEVIYNVIKFYDSTKTKEYSTGKYYYNFTDLSGPVSDIIKQLASHGIVNGYEDKTFKQNNNITRAEVTKIIFTAFNRKSNPGKKKYSDLDNKHWAYKYLMDASE